MRAALLVVLWTGVVAACGPGRGGYYRRSGRKLRALVYGQHVPNVREDSLGGSGLPEGRIIRNTTKFNNLETNYNKDIEFKDDEGTGADRVMSQRCKEKLNTLAISVMNQWPGVRLRVIEGWDGENSHVEGSLHYEGRAVDIITSDRDRSKYGMLARLAVEAGFDWVFYESRNTIHCSVKTESSVGTGSGCFPEGSMVQTPQGRRDIAQLQPGDEVLAADDKGNMFYSEVVTFIDRDPNATRQFIEVESDDGVVITTTPSHLLLLGDEKGWRATFAADVNVGDILLTKGHEKLKRSKVIRTKLVLRRGVYAPLTSAGTLLVDNALASCYALVRSHRLAHAVMAPLRWWPGRSGAPRGVHWYARALYDTASFMLPSSYTYRY